MQLHDKPSSARAGHLRLPIGGSGDVVAARSGARQLASELGFRVAELTDIAAVISELLRAVLAGASTGELVIWASDARARRGLLLEARSHGGGAAAAAQRGSELVALSRSLAAVRTLVDEFEISAQPCGGTAVRVAKWLR